MTASGEQVAGLLLLVAAVLGAVGYLIKKVRSAVHTADAIEELVAVLPRIRHLLERELEHNHGSSIRDDITGIAIGVGKFARQLDELRADFDDHVKKGRST